MGQEKKEISGIDLLNDLFNQKIKDIDVSDPIDKLLITASVSVQTIDKLLNEARGKPVTSSTGRAGEIVRMETLEAISAPPKKNYES